MLDFFLTLTATEASSLRWEEITHIEHLVQKIDASLYEKTTMWNVRLYSMFDFKKICIVTFHEDPVYLVVLKNMCFDMKYDLRINACTHYFVD